MWKPASCSEDDEESCGFVLSRPQKYEDSESEGYSGQEGKDENSHGTKFSEDEERDYSEGHGDLEKKEKFEIFVKMDTGKIIFKVMGTDTVASVKSRIEDYEDITVNEQKLFFDRMELEDFHTLGRNAEKEMSFDVRNPDSGSATEGSLTNRKRKLVMAASQSNESIPQEAHGCDDATESPDTLADKAQNYVTTLAKQYNEVRVARDEARQEIAALKGLLGLAENRAEVAEEKIKLLEASREVFQGDVEAKAKADILAAKMKAQEEKRQALLAMETYKASSQFIDEATHNGSKKFVDGWKCCKNSIQSLYPNLDLSRLKIPGESPRGSILKG